MLIVANWSLAIDTARVKMDFDCQFILCDPSREIVEEMTDWCCLNTRRNFIILEESSFIKAGGVAFFDDGLSDADRIRMFRRPNNETAQVRWFFRFYKQDAALFKLRWM